MYAQRVNRRVRETNRRKQPRYSPSATIGNHCAPSTAFQLDRRLFERSILPVALANGWVPGESSSGPVINFVNENIDNPVVTNAYYDLPYDDVIAIKVSVQDGTNAGDSEFGVLYSNGDYRNVSYADNDSSNDTYVITVDPLTMVVIDTSHETNPKINTYPTSPQAFISKLYLGGGGSIPRGSLVVTRLVTTSPEPTVKRFSADRMVYKFN